MDTENHLKTAYTLLPPPLSALPAKYWTSVSLLLHSYSVGRLFQELVDSYRYMNSDVPDNGEAFLIGFIHDLGQKLSINKKSFDNAKTWIETRLEYLSRTPHEARMLSKYLVTNVAETQSDPSYSREVWSLLWLADHIQGTNSFSDIIFYINEVKDKIGVDLVVNYYHVAESHPLFRFLISKATTKAIIDAVETGSISFALPISLPQGLMVLSDSALGEIIFDWDEIRTIAGEEGLLSDAEAKAYKEYINYCEKQEGGKPKGFKVKNCKPLGGLRLGTYETVILYYGPKDKAEEINNEIVLPADFADSLIRIKIRGVRFEKGNYVCPYCGMRTPHGVYLSEVADIIGRAAKEKWSRRFPPAHLNQLLAKTDTYLACPLCLGEALLYRKLFRNEPGEKVFIASTLNVPLPLSVAADLGGLIQELINTYGNKLITSESNLEKSLNLDILPKVTDASTVGLDAFSTTMFGITGLLGRKAIEVSVNGITLAGLLASWGLYPLVISPVPPLAPSDKLLSFYKSQNVVFNYSPADKALGSLTPYVSLLMLGIGNLYFRKFVKNESLPAVTEILDYPPTHAIHLLQYAAPRLYSHFESLRLELEEGDV